MKLLIAGSRSITDFDLTDFVPHEATLIISGGAKGIDTIAENFAEANGINTQVFLPEYELYGRGAPLVRNKEMVNFCDAVLVIWDGKSRGTKFTIDYAKKQGKPVTVITV